MQGSVFNVNPQVAEALDHVIDAERRRFGALSDEVPPEYLDALSDADLQGDFDPDAGQDARKRQLRAIAIRQGQPRFRADLLEAYGRRCAITNCDVTEALEAAHILSYLNDQRNHVSNGLLLRADVHTLFDLGLIAIGEDLEVLVAPGLRKTQFGADLSGRKLRAPNVLKASPNREALKRHRDGFKFSPSRG